ncbi:uncharacterized protein LOC141901896 [Tubulanus polymorphus]|uniref:uncharacterized protein LOC141901896 n=1 Tax=Tubulanus polymorphus TaxID=672921 RepID=UPI003DA4AB4A
MSSRISTEVPYLSVPLLNSSSSNSYKSNNEVAQHKDKPLKMSTKPLVAGRCRNLNASTSFKRCNVERRFQQNSWRPGTGMRKKTSNHPYNSQYYNLKYRYHGDMYVPYNGPVVERDLYQNCVRGNHFQRAYLNHEAQSQYRSNNINARRFSGYCWGHDYRY